MNEHIIKQLTLNGLISLLREFLGYSQVCFHSYQINENETRGHSRVSANTFTASCWLTF